MLSYVLAFVCLTACAQTTNYSVDVTTENIDINKVYLINAENQQVMTEADANHNQAHFEGQAEELPVVAIVSKDSTGEQVLARFILDGNGIALTVSAPAAGERTNGLKATGSPLTEKLVGVNAQIREKAKALQDFVQDVQTRYTQRPTDEQMAEIEAQYEQLMGAYTQTVKAGVTDNLDNKVSLVLMLLNFDVISDDFDFLQQTLQGYAFADNELLKPVHEYIAALTARQPGAELIDFELPDAAGTMHKLSEYLGQGKYVLVDFWASWCGPCRAEMPNVVAAYQKYHDKGFDILSLSFDSNRDAWLKAINDLGMTWHHLSDLKGWESLAAQKYGIRSIPSTLLFDPTGKVVAADLRGDALSAKLEEVMR